MDNPALTPHEHFTYGQYITWPDSERWELLEGQAWNMTAPLRSHQELIHRLALEFGTFLKGKPCKVYEAPFDVPLPRAGEWICFYRLEPGQAGLPRFDGGELREPDRDYGPIASRVLQGFAIDPAELFRQLE